MGTSTQHAIVGANSSYATPNFPQVSFDFSTENIPNADVLLPSLRMAGYSLESALGDLIDNCLDAAADLVIVNLELTDGDWLVSVADNGVGMDLFTLDQMMRLGSRSDHDLAVDLGAFGLGSTTASLALGRLHHVITRAERGNCLSAATDLDFIRSEGQFVKHLSQASTEELQLFSDCYLRFGVPVPETGTVVRILHVDRIGRQRLAPAVTSVKEYIASTYRYFIDGGVKFLVNGESVDASDPLERRNPETLILLDETFEYSFPKGHSKAGETEQIGAVLVQLPDWGGIEANQQHGYTIGKSGFYVMRNRREIVPASTLDLFSRHNEYSRFRGELLFPATLDDELGVSFLKSAWDIRPTQSLKDKIRQVVDPYRRQARRFYNKSLTNSNDQVPHDEAAKVIRQRAPFLRKPVTTIEKRESQDLVSDELKEPQATTRSRDPHEPKTQKTLADIAAFEVMDLGTHAPFYEATMLGRKVTITYNGQHPFYQRFILENRDDRSTIAAIDYLVYSMATAELTQVGDDNWRFFERFREDTSFNLRQLLNT